MREVNKYPTSAAEKETWLREGRVIDYPKSKPDEIAAADWDALRTIPSSMLKVLFDNETRTCNIPIRVRNAIIDQDLRLQYGTCPFDFSIADCTCQGHADFSFFRFEGVCDLRGTRFLQGAKFASVRFRYDVLADSSRFEKETSFQAMDVQGRFFA